MPSPTLSVVQTAPEQIDADVLVVGVSTGDESPILHSELDTLSALRGQFSLLGVTGGRDELVRLPVGGVAARAVVLVGLGRGEPTADALRHAAGNAARQLTGIDTLAFALPTGSADDVAAVLEGASLGAYSFSEFRGRSRETAKAPAGSIIVHAAGGSFDGEIERATVVADAMALVRDLVNTPPSVLYPESFAEHARSAVDDLPVDITVLGPSELEAGGYGGLLGVGGGSERGSRLVRLDYAPEGAAKHLALVGKGITFDTGGLSLKPAASMVGMKFDMAGAAAVLGTIVAAARLEVPVHLTGWLCLAENMPSGQAMRPNDVITIRGGTTVEVLNTDAEGRLVLADGLVAAGEEKPDAIVDIATLTGAAIVALGNRTSGVMGDRELVGRVCEAADRAGEQVWAMPLPDELRALLNSDVADIANAKIGSSAAGMLLAAVFLREFVTPEGTGGSIPWAHIDIAGTADNAAPHGFTGKGATGAGVRALLRLAESFGAA